MEDRLKFQGIPLNSDSFLKAGLMRSCIKILALFFAIDFNNLIYAIPQAEIDVKVGLYTQNAGYQ